MSEIGATLEAIKGFGGYTTSVTLWIFALVTWWKGLPVLIEVLSKAMDSWQSRAASIEQRLQDTMALTLERYDRQLAAADKRIDDSEARYVDSEKRHADCEERARKLSKSVDSLRDELDLVKQDLTGAKRQLATYEARGGEPVPVTGALFLAPNAPPVQRVKGE